jgi:callose synthase
METAGASTSSAAAAAPSRRRDALARTLVSRRLPAGVAPEAGQQVPRSVAPEVMPFIRAADEVEPRNPRVAFLCKYTPCLLAQSFAPRASSALKQ